MPNPKLTIILKRTDRSGVADVTVGSHGHEGLATSQGQRYRLGDAGRLHGQLIEVVDAQHLASVPGQFTIQRQ